jgi:HPt (histidine-containing phosphotransfer) domain-containing protein
MSDSPILEPEAIANLRSINPDDNGSFLGQLVDLFLSDAPQRIAQMEMALTQNRGTELGHLAHAIKGSAANFGASRLVALCFELEQLGKANQLAAVGEKLSALKIEFARTRPALEALKANA